MERRTWLAGTTASLLAPILRGGDGGDDWPILATNTYPWGTFARREGDSFSLHTDKSLAAIASSGLTGYEPILSKPGECEGLGERLRNHALSMRSFYMNSTLHEVGQAEESISTVLEVARAAKPLGARILVTNPSPIRWGGDEDKSDAQLRVQAEALDRLGGELAGIGMTLAYHNHDSELRRGAREFHHMLTATDPDRVKFCLDAHWVYRGCGDSEVALFDVLDHYADRVVELHLRQSRDGTWTEVFDVAGDIDYLRLAGELADREIRPHLVLEQAVEMGSPDTLGAVEAHRRGRAALAESLVPAL